jgi:hypothetical protein
MSLILAIEPDRRQAARINALARNPLNVEMVITESAERALAAISTRVPDLILTSRLLSPKDELLLDERLRELDAAGHKVQTLMIPMLASVKDSGKKGGLLNRLRRNSDAATADGGCDPAVFAEQIAEYLERHAVERAHRASLEVEAVPASQVVEPAPQVPAVSAAAEPAEKNEEPDTSVTVPDKGLLPEAGVEEALSAPPVHAASAAWQELSLDQAPLTGAAAGAAVLPVEPPDQFVSEFADTDLWSSQTGTATAVAPPPAAALKKSGVTNEEWGSFDPAQSGFVALLEKLQVAD